MKTLSFVIALIIHLITAFAQDRGNERADITKHFVRDMQRDVSNADVFKKYLRSAGNFENEKLSQAANEWTTLLRNSIKSTIVDEIVVYKYTEHPEKAKKLKAIEDPDNEQVEYAPLEFELRSKSNTINTVEINDLYVIKIREERIFVLFDHSNKMITYFGLKWGQKVELTEL
jgi:hypothetical protein